MHIFDKFWWLADMFWCVHFYATSVKHSNCMHGICAVVVRALCRLMSSFQHSLKWDEAVMITPYFVQLSTLMMSPTQFSLTKVRIGIGSWTCSSFSCFSSDAKSAKKRLKARNGAKQRQKHQRASRNIKKRPDLCFLKETFYFMLHERNRFIFLFYNWLSMVASASNQNNKVKNRVICVL